MRIYVESVVKHTAAQMVTAPTFNKPDAFVAGKVGTAVEVTVRALCSSPEEAAEWEAAVGKTLEVSDGPS